MQLHSSLHAAAASLNPSIFYSPNFKIDLGVRNGFQDTMLKMATTQEDKMDITKEHPMYVNAQGALGTDFAIMGRTLNAPGSSVFLSITGPDCGCIVAVCVAYSAIWLLHCLKPLLLVTGQKRI
ncbi:unnamed protein product [Prunus armeniaca]|uniref:Uncharacterized protein n=1 Tax=Prunus armeniaca TaxID=36596 RepID=A0A6J5XGR4_PRUAR|nr:unnamed protein product [Prunus armeniaca]